MTDQRYDFHRRSLRLRVYDYSQAGAYFLTVCAHAKLCLFGEIEHGLMRLNQYGKIVAEEWLRSAAVREEIECGEFVVMPNHFHGIVHIVRSDFNTENQGYFHTESRAYCHTPLRSPSRNLGAMVRGFKSAVSNRINEIRHAVGVSVWQRNYYEHVIRDDADYNRIVEYILENPQRWMEDSLHP